MRTEFFDLSKKDKIFICSTELQVQTLLTFLKTDYSGRRSAGMKRRIIAQMPGLLLACLIIGGCSEYQLVTVDRSGHSWNDYKPAWKIRTNPTAASNEAERLAVDAARRKSYSISGVIEAYYINSLGNLLIVAEVTDRDIKNEYWLKLKYVKKYNVYDDKIYGETEELSEPFPNADFELAVFRAANEALSNEMKRSVVIYMNSDHPIILRGTAVQNCAADVGIIEGHEPYLKPIYVKHVDYCNLVY